MPEKENIYPLNKKNIKKAIKIKLTMHICFTKSKWIIFSEPLPNYIPSVPLIKDFIYFV